MNMIEAYLIHLAILILIYLVLALSLQLAMGFTGLFNLGHIAFFAIGAYASALLTLNGFPFEIAFLSAGILAAVAGYLLSYPLTKLKGDYFALGTLGFSFVVYAIALNWMELTRGPLGLPGIPKPSFLGFSFTSLESFFVLALVVAVITYFLLDRLTKSPYGRVLQAIRDDEKAAQSLGKNTFKLKQQSLAIASLFAGLAGSLYAHYITYIDPSSFTLWQLVPVLSIVILAGLASLPTTIVATILIVLLPEPLRFIGFPSSVVGPAQQILYALILILILLFYPKGMDGKVEL